MSETTRVGVPKGGEKPTVERSVHHILQWHRTQTVTVTVDDARAAAIACRELSEIIQKRGERLISLGVDVDNSTARQYYAHLLLVADRIERWMK